MLVLTRKKDQTLVIGDNIEITVLDIQGDQIRFGINAPKSVKVYRKEIYLEIMQENKNAAMQAHSNPKSLNELIKPGSGKKPAVKMAPPRTNASPRTNLPPGAPGQAVPGEPPVAPNAYAKAPPPADASAPANTSASPGIVAPVTKSVETPAMPDASSPTSTGG